MSDRKPRRVVVLGGGFGGVYAARELVRRSRPDRPLHVTLVNRENFFLFTPMLHEVAASDLDLTHIVNPLRKLLPGVHLFHGTWSLFQSMGWNNPRFNSWRKALATGIATIVVVGNVSFPIMTLAGVIEFDDSVTSVHELHSEAGE